MAFNLTPPQPAPVWNHTAEQILSLTKEAIERDREVQNKVAALDPKDANFESVSLAAPFSRSEPLTAS